MANFADIYKRLVKAGLRQSDELVPLADDVIPAIGSQVDNVAEEMLPATRLNTLPTEVPPQVVGTGTPSARPPGSVLDADFEEVYPSTGIPVIPQKLSPLAAGMGAAGLGTAAYMMSGDDGMTPPPQAPQPKTQSTPAPKAEDKKTPAKTATTSKEMSDTDKARAAMDKFMANIPKDTPPEVQEQQAMQYADLLAQAQGRTADNQFMAGLLRAGNQAGAAIASLGAGSQVKPDYSGVEALEKTAGTPSQNTKDLQAASLTDQRARQAQAEMNDDNKRRDANSEISKTARQLATQLGIKVTDQISAKQLQDAGLPLGTLLSTKMAADSRREMMALSKDSKDATKKEGNALKVQGSVDKQTTQLLKSKDYEAYNAAKDAQYNLAQAIASGNKTDAGTAFMTFAKIAQGDNSVVRDGDMAILAGGMNYKSPTEMLTKLSAQAGGGRFNSVELENMRKVAAKVQEIKGRRVQQLVSPIVKRADAAGLDLAETIDPAVIEEFAQFSPNAKSEGIAPANNLDSKAEMTPKLIRVTRKSDGVSKMVTPEQARKADKSKYTVGE